MTKQLTVHNAEVRTAAVEVRSLTISGKQVTLAVFRQLMEEHPLNERAGWKGVPWGFVNYLNDDKQARHIVWQSGTELRRGIVKRPDDKWQPPATRLQHLYVTALIVLGHVDSREGGIGHSASENDPPDHFDLSRNGMYVDLEDGVRAWGCLLARKTRRYGGESTWEWTKAGAVEAVDLAELARALPIWRQRCHDQLLADRAHWENHTTRWQEVLALDQLFIAV